MLMFASSQKPKVMSEFSLSKTVEGLKVETDFINLIVRIYRAGNVIRQIDCREMSLAEYDRAVARVINESS